MQKRFSSVTRYVARVFVALGISVVAQAQTYTFSTLYSFKNNGKDPASSIAPLIIDAAGDLYGTSAGGGDFGFGTVFKVTKAGALTVLHSFKGGPSDGSNPDTGLARDSAGNLYGTTYPGGSAGCGVVFKLTSSGHETILYNFTCGADGEMASKLVRDSAGNLYGTAQGGVNGSGIIFKIDTINAFSVFYNFCSLPGCADGGQPGDPIQDRAGNLYIGNSSGNGTVFKITPAGVGSVLYTFAGPPTDGSIPVNSLKLDALGNLYGVTIFGGTQGDGTLFTLPKAGGADTVLYDFCSVSRCRDGKFPVGPVQIDKSKNLYGLTLKSALNAGSVVWERNAAGKESILFTFAKNVENFGGLTIDSAGNLYGATVSGGTNKTGSVYKLTLVK